MTKLKCDNCGEKNDRIHMTCECSKCYQSGWKKEGFISIKEVEKLIDRYKSVCLDKYIMRDLKSKLKEI